MIEPTRTAILVSVAISLASAAAARASETALWIRTGATSASVDADLKACGEEARRSPMHVSAPVVSAPVVAAEVMAGAAGGAIAAALVVHRREQDAREIYGRHCMRRRGYAWLPLTDREETALMSRKTQQERAAWIDAFYAGDLAARIEAASKPIVAPLPEAAYEPLAFAGVRLDPSALTVASGPVAEGGAVLAGKIAHRRTARLKQSVDLEGARLDAPAGAVFHQLVIPTDFEPDQTIWCASMRVHGALLVKVSDACVWTTEFGYAIVRAGGEPWLAVPNPDAPAFKSSIVDFSLDDSHDDLIGPMDFALVVKRVADKSVTLEAQASKDGKTVTFWRADLALNPDGKAILPFWTHRLTLTRAGKTVTAAFTADGDGPGWDDAKLAE